MFSLFSMIIWLYETRNMNYISQEQTIMSKIYAWNEQIRDVNVDYFSNEI